MVGATATVKYPDTAPVGTVNVIEVSLQELIVTGTSFSTTRLLPWVAPNPEPETVDWLPMNPPSGITLLIEGAGLDAVLMDTLSNVAVVKLDVDPLVTPNPMYTS